MAATAVAGKDNFTSQGKMTSIVPSASAVHVPEIRSPLASFTIW